MCFGFGGKSHAPNKPKKTNLHKECPPCTDQPKTPSGKNPAKKSSNSVTINSPKTSNTAKPNAFRLGGLSKSTSKTASIRTASSHTVTQNQLCNCPPPTIDTDAKSMGSQTKREYNIKIVSAVDLTIFQKDFLIAHNAFRICHGCKALALKHSLTKHAQKWADECATKDRMAHNPDQRYGENVYSCSGFEPTGFHVSNSWYLESNKFDFEKPAFSMATGHFTNMIWKETSAVGVGVARSIAGNYFVVACYNPVGNVNDEFQENVPPRRPHVQLPVEQIYRQQSSGLFGYRFNNFQRECLDVHNELRAKHKTPQLNLEASLCHSAQFWAEQLAAANELSYATKAAYGQNVHLFKATLANKAPVDGGRAVRDWYGESHKYKGSLNPAIIHFTQVVWNSTRELGVGVAKSRTGDVYTVAHYFPPGNITGQHEQNVLNWQKSKGK